VSYADLFAVQLIILVPVFNVCVTDATAVMNLFSFYRYTVAAVYCVGYFEILIGMNYSALFKRKLTI